MKRLLFAAFAAACAIASLPGDPEAADARKTFALVPKLAGVPFYNDVKRGCEVEAKKLNVTCVFTGTPKVDEEGQVAIIRELIARKVDGLAIAPNNPDTIGIVIKEAQDKGIPVVTFDSDAPKSTRTTFIGTNNYEGGVQAGKAFHNALPSGGLYAILTGGLAADNLNARIKGFRSALDNSFIEFDGSPFPCEDNGIEGTKIVADLLSKHPDIKGFFFSGGWPMFTPDEYSTAMKGYYEAITKKQLVIVSFDAVESQLKLLKAGMATALVGQRPYKMGVASIDVLDKLSSKLPAPPVIDTGVDVIDAAFVNQ